MHLHIVFYYILCQVCTFMSIWSLLDFYFPLCRLFMHRYRDVDPEIRMSCIKSLGIWVVSYPSFFLQDIYLKYLGWTLNDKVANVSLHLFFTSLKLLLTTLKTYSLYFVHTIFVECWS